MIGLGLALAVGGLASAGEETARERLEALIESTNQLEHFHVEYGLKHKEGVGRLWIDYDAPQSIRLRVESPDGGFSWGCSDDILWMAASSPTDGGHHARVDFMDRSGVCEQAAAVLRGDFWHASEGPVVSIVLSWALDPEADKHDLSLSVAHTITGRTHAGVLGWLATMKELEGELTLEGDELVHRSARAEARVDATTGFLKRLVLTSSDGVEGGFELVRLDLETAPLAELFVPPEPDPSAQDRSEELQRTLLSRHHLRLHALRHVHGLLDDGERRFDDEIHDELERFFIALYDSKITGDLEKWIESSREYAIQYADWLRSQLQSGRSREELETAVAVRRDEIVANLENARTNLCKIVPDDPEGCADSRHWRAIRELEDTVLNARFDALVAQPMLDGFDAAVEGALGT